MNEKGEYAACGDSSFRASMDAGLADLAATCMECRLCHLAATRSSVVFGEGGARLGVMFVGEGPGADEDRLGRPFVGKAGQLLDRILSGAGIARQDVYITNVVKCRPPGNRNPRPDEISACERYLLAQIDILSPRIIVTLGNVAMRFFLGDDTPGISKMRGGFYPWLGGDIEIFPMFHPSYLLRNDSRSKGSPKWLTWQDIKALAARLNEQQRSRV